MDLPVSPPVKPMLAKAIEGIPVDGDLIFEPKYDGFRCIVFRDGDEVVLGSRNERPLTRYFPEMLVAMRDHLPDRCVVDGELVVVTGDRLDFDALQQRIHPADSRVRMLAERTPASFMAFDLLALDHDDLRRRPFRERRRLLTDVLRHAGPPVHRAPSTEDRAVALDWFVRFEGAGLDGLIAKPADGPYVEDKRVQFKVKHVRSADVVVAGFRWHKDGQGVGSLLLGLYEDGTLHHVGVAASFAAKRRVELVDELSPLADGALADHPWREWADAESHDTGRMPGAPSRWSGQRDASWIPLRLERVCEVKYSSTLSGRFRGVTQFLRWRPDKLPEQCTYDQLEEPEPMGFSGVLAAGEAAAPP
ncbi:MAG TPA: ATP-dependent DNA ligase [Ilumatobacteraceae bacterium]